MTDVVANIRLFSEGEGSIWLLRLCAHGSPGYLDLGQAPGLTFTTAKEFAALRGYFSPGARGIELHACWVASGGVKETRKAGETWPAPLIGGKGELFMQELAKNTGVPVMAGFETQYAQKAKDYVYAFEGPMITVFP